MKKILSIFAVAAAILAAASCAKEKPEASKEDNGTIELSVTGILGEYQADGTKSSLVNNIRVAWTTGDVVLVFDKSNGMYLGQLTATVGEDNREAKLGGNIKATEEGNKLAFFHGTGLSASDFTVGTIYSSVSLILSSQGASTPFLVYGDADYSASGISNLVVHFKFASSVISTYITGLPANTAISSVLIQNVNTRCNISISDFGLGGSDIGTITLTSPGSSKAKGEAYVEIAVPPMPTKKDKTADVIVGGVTLSGTFSNSVLDAGRSYNTIVEMNSAAGPFPFSVSDTKKVYFSQGNLYYNGSAFGFEEHQYDFSSSWNTSHVSHFYWSKTPSVAIAQKYEDSSILDTDVLFTNATAEAPNASFIVNGETGVWRTLSSTEWNYLIYADESFSSPIRKDKWGSATIYLTNSKVTGIVIVPDTWVSLGKNYLTPGKDNGFNTNTYSSAQWEAMEKAGAVFLPCIGARMGELAKPGTEINPTMSRYLTSESYINKEHPEDPYALMLYINDANPGTSEGGCNNGFAIRLVKDVK